MILKQVQKEIKDGLKTYKVFQELDGVLEKVIQLQGAEEQKNKLLKHIDTKIAKAEKDLAAIEDVIKKKQAESDIIIDEAKKIANGIKEKSNLELKEEVKKLKQEASNKQSLIKTKEKKLKDVVDAITLKTKEEQEIVMKLEAARKQFRELLGE